MSQTKVEVEVVSPSIDLSSAVGHLDGGNQRAYQSSDDGRNKSTATATTSRCSWFPNRLSIFYSPPTLSPCSSSSSPTTTTTNTSSSLVSHSFLLPCLCMFCSFYNYAVVGVISFLLRMDPSYQSFFATFSFLPPLLDAMIFLGALCGQVVLGWAADFLGRRKTLLISLSFMTVGALGAGLCSWGPTTNSSSSYETDVVGVTACLCVWRFVVGIGTGGSHVLSAVSTAECGEIRERKNLKPVRMGILNLVAFFACVIPWVVCAIVWNSTTAILSLDDEGNSSSSTSVVVSWTWRSLSVVGGLLPGLFALPLVLFCFEDGSEFVDSKKKPTTSQQQQQVGMWSGLKDRQYWKKLTGTAGVMFLYCFLCWGVIFIQPSIAQNLWGASSGSSTAATMSSVVNAASWQNIVLLLTQLPGIVNTILVIGKVECKWLLFWGFFFFSLSSVVMGIALLSCPHSSSSSVIILMILLCVVNYFLVWGSVGCILLLPSLVFPPECRGTYFGLSVAAGKIGACVGVYIYRALYGVMGGGGTMFLTAGVSAAACLLVWLAVEPHVREVRPAAREAVDALFKAWPYGTFGRSRTNVRRRRDVQNNSHKGQQQEEKAEQEWQNKSVGG
eukprot:GHVS01074478.1.p1 GENE.GHVS01074478.1~~GHVS01074478.1.p1  ORF type:complete len:614 (-),score=119.29 GHVS01074478.1:310-2151(-)